MPPLDALLSKPEQRLMSAILLRPDKDFGTLELLERMGNGRGAGSAVLQRWLAAGLLREQRVGNQRRLSVDPSFVLYTELRQMVLKTVGMAEPLAKALAPLASRLMDAFVFGSVAAGRDSSESDIDVVVVGDVNLFDVSPLFDSAELELGRPVHVNVYSQLEWASNDPVLVAIRTGPKIDLMEAIRAKTSDV